MTSFLLLLAVSDVQMRGGRTRIVVYARFSTDQQSPRSIGDQVAICRKHLDAIGLGDTEIIVVKDEAISGEHARRPGIDQVWDLIESGECDVLIAEDLSRLYRHSTRAMELIEAAVDAGVRVIAINSNIDTDEDESRWRMGSHFASMKAEMDNTETRKRIVRSMEGLWRDGFTVGALKPGYIRVPTAPATDREPAKGPFHDEKDANWTPTITSQNSAARTSTYSGNVEIHFNRGHLDHILREDVRFHNRHRPHQGLGNRTLATALCSDPPILERSESDPIRCKRILGGLLRHY